MGIGSRMIEVFAQLYTGGLLARGDSVFELGRQELHCTDDKIAVFTSLFGVSAEGMAGGYSQAMFEKCGFRYASLDAMPGGYELDLNSDLVPLPLVGTHQLVTNFGTTEHVCNQGHAFKVIHDLTKLGGIMVHNLPMQGNINHGLVLYTPKFFDRLASRNGYERLLFTSDNPNPRPVPEDLGRYMENFDRIAKVQFHDLAMHCVLKKPVDFRPFRLPFDGEIDKMSEKWRAKYG